MTQLSARGRRFAAEAVLAAVTAMVGTSAAVMTVRDDGSTSGARWMVAFAVAGLLGLAVVITGVQRSAARRVVVGLVLTALAPTVFASPLNLLLLLAAAGETAAMLRRPRARVGT